ncbi:hypothetical protein Pcinc_024639 [Petrolisthes cinctipes]|uniref:Uncharacterized protein n=1 Tax=Petrolisthes cinctipes TaxID=88211 RepID=A0AAE1FC95_PETCI|nr:hypothetical protein Pcinc_024639 [Petrolisthes cinctipes]
MQSGWRVRTGAGRWAGIDPPPCCRHPWGVVGPRGRQDTPSLPPPPPTRPHSTDPHHPTFPFPSAGLLSQATPQGATQTSILGQTSGSPSPGSDLNPPPHPSSESALWPPPPLGSVS